MSSQPNPVPGYPPSYSSIASQTIPNGLELLQAHIYFRHGERTPVKERLTHLGIPSQWNMCGGRIDKPGSLWYVKPRLHSIARFSSLKYVYSIAIGASSPM